MKKMKALQRRIHTFTYTVKWVAIIYILTYIVCLPFRETKERADETSYKLLQAYVESGLLGTPPIRHRSCSNGDVFLLIMVPSAVSNFEQRDAIRRTWGNVSTTKPSVLLKFVLGKSKDSVHQSLAKTENSIHNDILFEDILETYENLSQKSIALLRWASTNCERVRYLLKIDDDMFLNLPRLLNELKVHPKTNSISGCKVIGASPFRFAFSKWKISRSEYKNDYYPDYIAGTAYLISGDIISNLSWATRNVPYFIFEDVYITGLCRKHIGAVALENKGFNCGYRNRGPCGNNFRYQITGHHYTPREIKRMWRELQNRWSNCRLVDHYFIYKLVDLFKYMFL
eukprot:XP_011455851.1 PREDICTED: beta-1,3-galactosyltransferase 1-like [Crassostrea gigas]